MKTTLRLLCFWLCFFTALAQTTQTGSMGIRINGGTSNFLHQTYNFSPVAAYGLAAVLNEKDQRFSLRTEVGIEQRGAFFEEEQIKCTVTALGASVLPQLKFGTHRRHALLVGAYLAFAITKTDPTIAPPTSEVIRYGPPFAAGGILAYKYAFLQTEKTTWQADLRGSYGYVNVRDYTFRNIEPLEVTVQLGISLFFNHRK